MISFYKNHTVGVVPTDKWEPNCWINVVSPTNHERAHLIDTWDIPSSFLSDIEDIDERPRLEMEDGWQLVILRVPIHTPDDTLPYSTIPLGLIFKDDVTVSVCHYQTDMLPDFILYTKRKNINFANSYDLTLKLLLSASVWFLKYLKQANMRIKSAEKELERSIRNEDLQTLLQIEKCLVFFITSLKGNDILLHKLRNLKPHRDFYDPELIEDVEIELKQAQETTNIYSDILSGMMDAYASVISNNLNVIMKQLTSVSIILMIPTLIASIYGMNVPNAFQDKPWGIYAIILISFGLAGFGVFMFKRKRWF
jgi:magnesium transporter